MSNQNIGTVTQIIGPVLDIKFPDGHLPGLLNAITVENGADTITLEVAQHIGDDVVRCIAMSSTDGLVRGAKAVDTGSPITVPVGDQCLGRIFNLLGDPVDNLPAPEAQERWPIHRQPPAYDEQESTTEILETGIKVVDLIAPYAKGGKIGLFGGAGVGKTVLIMELINNCLLYTSWVATVIPLLFPRLTILAMQILGMYKPPKNKEGGDEPV